jgi:hypothetical protein
MGLGLRACVVVALLMMLASASRTAAQDPPPDPKPVLSDDGLLRKYVLSTLGPTGQLHATLESAFDQWRNSPQDWGQTKTAYVERWASDFGASAIGSTTKYAVARVAHQDPSFVRCRCTGIGPRLRHALTAPFAARTRDGRRVFSLATVAGLAAENVVPAATWYPAPRGTRDGLAHAGTGILSKIGVDVLKEFVDVHRIASAATPKR